MKYTPQFTRVILPFTVLTPVLIYFYSVNWFWVAVFFLLFGLIGNGVVGHRLVAHRQFTHARWLRKPLLLLCTLGAIAPVWYWRIQHWHHHKYSDQEADIHSPITKSWFISFFGWAIYNDFVKQVLATERRSLRESLADPDMRVYFKHTYNIVWAFMVLLFLIDPVLLASYLAYYWIEQIRFGLTTTYAHKNCLFSYRNFETREYSTNNYIIGHLTFGLGWHNNHHAHPMRLDNQVRWWEWDAEAKLAKLISLIPGSR